MPTSPNPLRTLSWAVYLACSWTWCIGMFLPVLLVRDYGLAGWVVFAVPNVIGAAAMGWFLARPGSSEKMVAEHRNACVAFSAVTLAFHGFFLSWFALRIIPLSWCIAAVAAGSALVFIQRPKRRFDLALAWVVFAISLTVLAHGLMHPQIPDRNHGVRSSTDLYFLAPICVFGFALCPYLDLTFHQARQANTPAAAKRAFGIGFGLFFLAMICLTPLYEGDIVYEGRYGSFGSNGLRTWVALHMAVQIGFTWAAHLRAQPRFKKLDVPIWLIAMSLAVVGGVAVWMPSLAKYQWPNELSIGEVIYRVFMSFYGLMFPAYVWLCIVPLRGRSVGVSMRALLVCAIAVLVAAPMFWMGFINGQMAWLLPGLAVVLASRLLVKGRALSLS